MPVSRISAFTEPSDYQAELSRDAEVDFLVTERGAFRAELTRIALSRLSLSAGEEHLARIAVIAIGPQSVRIMLPVRACMRVVSSGAVVHPGEIVAHGPGFCVHERTDGPCRWRSVWVRARDLAQYGRAVTGKGLEVPAGESRWRPKRAALRALVDLHDNAVRLTAAHPGVATGEEAASGLEQQLIHALIDCLATPPDQCATPSGGRPADVMGRFSEVLRIRDEQAVTVSELCAGLDVSERDLQAYCIAYLGMSPHEYLHRKRLVLARRLLRAANPEIASVSEIAQRCGFNAPGRFAVIYRAQFGELPSVTLSSSRRFSRHWVHRRRGSAGE